MKLFARKQVRLAIGIIIAVGVAALCYWKLRPSPARESYERGVQLAAIGMNLDARDAYLEAIRRDRAYAPPYRAVAEMAGSSGALDVSVRYWKDYLSLAPKARHVLCRLAGVELISGLEVPALRDAEEELRKDPDCARAHLIAGALYVRKSEPKRALDHLEPAARAYPADLRVQLEYSRVLSLVGDYGRAEQVLQTILKRDRSHAQPLFWLGYVYSRRGPDSKSQALAEQYLRQALDLQPEHPEANFEIGRLYFGRHEAAKALPFAERAVSSRKHYPSGLYLLAQIYDAVHRASDAGRMQAIFKRESDLAAREKALLRQFGLDRKNVETALALGEVEIARDKPEGALLFLREAANIDPADERVKGAISRAERLRAGSAKEAPQKIDDSSVISSIAEMTMAGDRT